MGVSVPLALMAAGSASSAIGASKSAQAQKATLAYEAAVAANNQKIAEQQAQLAEQNGAVAEQTSELRTAALKGDQRAAMAANGVDLGVGSAAEILATTEFMGKRDALTIRDNAARQAWALREQGKGYLSEAAADTAASDAINPSLAAVTSLLGSAGSVASSYYKYNSATKGK